MFTMETAEVGSKDIRLDTIGDTNYYNYYLVEYAQSLS